MASSGSEVRVGTSESKGGAPVGVWEQSLQKPDIYRQFATVKCSGGARILEQAGPAAGPKVLW